MAFSVTIDHARHLVRVEHFDDMGEDEMFTARAQAGSLLKQHGYSHVLVDARRIYESPNTLVTFSISTSHNTVLPPHFRFALLVSPDMIADALFSENVAVNRGFSYKAFLDEDDAIAWLNQSETSG